MSNSSSLIIQQHLLSGVCYLPSPNQDALNEMPSLVVIHNISLPPNQFGGMAVADLFTNQLNPEADSYFAKIAHLKVSAHLWIRRNGEVIQFVPFNRRAWHAGVSSYQGRERCNDFSIGIELEGSDFTPFTNSQYQTLNRVLAALWQTYPTLSDRKVVGHSDIAPGRKTDPGPYFLWQAIPRHAQS